MKFFILQLPAFFIGLFIGSWGIGRIAEWLAIRAYNKQSAHEKFNDY